MHHITINDPVALGAYMHFRDSGIKIPDEIALIGFSNNPNTTLIRPRLTTVSQPAFEMGKVAATLLLKKLGSSSIMSSAETVVLKTELLIRESA